MSARAGFLLAIAFAACTRGAEPNTASPAAVPNASPPSASAPPAGPDAAGQAAADARIAEALALVSEVRELAVKQPVPGVRLDRASLRVEVERMLADEAPPELVAGNTDLLFALDTVPASFDLKAALAVLYGAQLAGFYDPDKKRMVLASDLGADGERLTLYHELVHALQDQHYDLANALDWRPEQSDVQAALHCLGEGDATNTMVQVFARSSGQPAQEVPPELLRMDGLLMEASPELRAVPAVITRSLIAPYADGLAFVNALRQRFGGYAGVDAAWRERPLSTEQILHPEKYLAREPVVPIADLSPPAGFAGPVYRDVMGEQSLRLLFEEWAPSRRAAEAATGWGGDRLAIFERGAQRLVLWHLAFDTDAAAERAFLTFARGALRPELPADAPPVESEGPRPREFVELEVARAQAGGGKLCQQRAQRGAVAMVRRGSHIGITLGPFERSGTSVRGAGSCPEALGWAEALTHPR